MSKYAQINFRKNQKIWRQNIKRFRFSDPLRDPVGQSDPPRPDRVKGSVIISQGSGEANNDRSLTGPEKLYNFFLIAS